MKKGVKIALIAVVSVLVVLGAGFAVVYATQGDYVRNSWAMLTKNDKEYLQWTTEKNLDRGMEAVKTMYEEKKEIDEFTLTSDASFEIGNALLELVAPVSIRDIKPVNLFSQIAYKDSDLGTQFGIGYNNVDILSLASQINLENKELYLAVPEYKKEAIDLSELMQIDLSSLFSDEQISRLNEKFAESGMDINASAKDFKDPASIILFFKDAFLQGYENGQSKGKEYFDEEALNSIEFRDVVLDYIENLDSVELEKNVDVNVNGISTTCNSLTFELTKKDIINVVLNFLDKNEDSLKTALKKVLEESKGEAEFDKFLDEMKKELQKAADNKEVSFGFDVVLYVDKEGKYIGANIRFSVDSYKFRVEFINSDSKEDAEAGIERFGMEISMNSTTLAKISVVKGKEDDYNTCEITVVPGSMINTLIGEKKNLELKIKSKNRPGEDETDTQFDIAVNMNDAKFASLSLSFLFKNKAEFVIDKANSVALSKLGESGYFSIRDLANYGFGKLEEVNDSNLINFINSSLESFPGDIHSYDDLKKSFLGTDTTELDTMINQSLTKGINTILDAIKSGALFAMSDSGAEKFFADAFSLKPAVDLDAPLAFPQNELAGIVIPFDYGDLDVDTYYMEIPNPNDYIEPFLAECSSKSVLSSDASRTVQMNDKILFNAVPILAGFEVSTYEYTGVPTTIGKYEYGDGIDDMLIGMHSGESKKLELTLDDRFGDFAGYSGTFKITVAGIYDVVEPAWTDEYIVSALGYASLDDCMNTLCPDMSAKRIDKSGEEIENDLEQFVLDNFVDKAKMAPYCEKYADILEKVFDRQIQSIDRDMYLSYTDYLKSKGLSDSEAEEQLNIQIARNVARLGIDAYIVEKDGLEISYRDLLSELVPGASDEDMINIIENSDQELMDFEIAFAYDNDVWEKFYNIVVTK